MKAPVLRRVARHALPLSLVLLLAACSGSGPQSSLEPQGPIAREIDGLWLLVFWIATAIFFAVQIALLVAVFKFRERPGDDRQPKQIHGNTRLEIIWTILPAVLLAGIAVPTLRTLLDIRTPPEGDFVEVTVIGHQWWWEFQYPQFTDAAGRPLTTANELHIPEDEMVYLTMTSADVIHSFWVPPLNGKRDVVPGKITNLKLVADDPTPEGSPIFGQCAEFCGLAHADMRLRVFVHTRADFEAWVDEQLAPAAVPASGVAASGYDTFGRVCTACHTAVVDGEGGVELLGPSRVIEAGGERFEVALAPDLTHFGSRTTFGSATFVNDAPHLSAWLDNPSALKPMDPDRNDIPSGRILGMPDFGLSADEIDGLVALLESWR